MKTERLPLEKDPWLIQSIAELKSLFEKGDAAALPNDRAHILTSPWVFGDTYFLYEFFGHAQNDRKTIPAWMWNVCKEVVDSLDQFIQTQTPITKDSIEGVFLNALTKAAIGATTPSEAVGFVLQCQKMHLSFPFNSNMACKNLVRTILAASSEEMAQWDHKILFGISRLMRDFDVNDVNPELSAAFDRYYQVFRAPHMAEERRAGTEQPNMRQVINPVAWTINPKEWPEGEEERKKAARDAGRKADWIDPLLHYTRLEQVGPLAKAIIQRAEAGDNNQPLAQVTQELHRLHTVSIGSVCMMATGESKIISRATKILFDRQKDCEAILVETHEQTVSRFLGMELQTMRGESILAADYIRRAAENWPLLSQAQRIHFYRTCVDGLAVAAGIPSPLFDKCSMLPGTLGGCSDKTKDSPAKLDIAPELTPYFLGAFGTSTHEFCHHSHHAWQAMDSTQGSSLGEVLNYLDANYCIYIRGHNDFAGYRAQPVEEDPNRFAAMFVKALTGVVSPELLLGSKVPSTGLTVEQMVDLREQVESYLAGMETHADGQGGFYITEAKEISRYRELKTLYQQSPVAAGILYQQQEAARKSGAKQGSDIAVFGERGTKSGFPLGMAARIVRPSNAR